eukprot:CAMPEP_0182538128 /NCGR_PEP_ID=MMETSP1323-20130603/23215_1 /TAXON_ID=236787 /ORGANISM="Florenciella parvula, Strain RCC1693" /LENGTH=54 /DNA_ID=CAMNT_0024748577 /DNA_START=234 /DNA_END=398 /DNA_ORIENTATION=+
MSFDTWFTILSDAPNGSFVVSSDWRSISVRLLALVAPMVDAMVATERDVEGESA